MAAEHSQQNLLRQEPYAEPDDSRRPPYFGESEPAARRGPISYPITTTFAAEGGLISHGPKLQHVLDLDAPPPPAPDEWVKSEVERMYGPDRSVGIVEAGRQLEPKMWEAFRRRQVDDHWTAESITNHLRDSGLWRPRRPTPRRAR